MTRDFTPSDPPLRTPDTGEHRALFPAKELFISQVLECLEDFVLLTAGFVSFFTRIRELLSAPNKQNFPG